MQLTNCPKCGGFLQAHTAGYSCNKCYAQFDIKGEEIYIEAPKQQQKDPLMDDKYFENLMRHKYIETLDRLGQPNPMPGNWNFCPHCGHKLS